LKPDKATTLPLVRFSFSLGEGERFPASGRQIVATSPDGTQIVYAASNRLYRRSIDDLASHAIPGTELPVADLGTTITSPVFSPDGNSIAFFSSGAIKRIPLSGGSPTTISPATNPRGISWNRRGIVFAGEDGKIFLVSPNGGKPEELVSLKNAEIAYGPEILPGGDSLLFTVAHGPARAGTWDQAEVVVQSLTSGTRKTIVEGGSDGRYLPSGQLIYALSGTVYAVGFNPRTQLTNGERIPVLSGVRRAFIRADIGAAQLSISATGTLVYIPGPVNATSTQPNTLVVSDRNGKMATLKVPSRNYVHPRVSRDGSRLAVGTDEGGRRQHLDLRSC
jgi:Tol biopolymer transport system component